MSSITLDDNHLKFALNQVGASFEGSVEGAEVKGTFRQGAASVPLTLRPLKPGDLERKRPQVPVKPYPYIEEEVVIENRRVAGVRLAGTLTIPPGKGPFPALVFITGSGPQTRDQEIFGHPTFLVLADALTRGGVATLRYDDRGVGKSTGDFAAATGADFADDAEVGFDFLRKDKRFRRIGLLGHSEGGAIAPVVAVRQPKVGFLVLLAPPAVKGRDIILEQKAAILQASGVLFPDVSADRKVLDAIVAGEDVGAVLPANVPKAQREFLLSPWMRQFLSFDPAIALRSVKVPVLALFGEKDLQVLPRQNEPPFRAAMAGNKRVSIAVLPSMNHLFQTTKSGLPTEYGTNEETFSVDALKRIQEWIAGLR